MEKIRQKILLSLQEKIGKEFGDNIMIALKDKGIENSIMVLMKQDKIQLVNENNQPKYQAEINKAVVLEEKKKSSDSSLYSEEDFDDEEEAANMERDISPMKGSKTLLVNTFSSLINNMYIENERQ